MFEYNCIKQLLQYQLSPMDFVHVSSPFLVSNDKAIPENDKKQLLLIMFHMILIG